MATQRQIEANLRNSRLSKGPVSPEGKKRSSLNATRHGMAARSAEAEAALSPEFLDRRARWAAEYQPEGDLADYALDQAVAASLRIERCGRTLDALAVAEAQRARLAWHQDREVEAATILARLSRDPVLASRQLRATLAGVRMLIDAWFALEEPLEDGRDWTEAEASKALDLLGVAPDCRGKRTPIRPFDETDPVAFRTAVAHEEIERLEVLRDEVMAPLDELGREIAEAGDMAMLSRPGKLVLRYEREAWRRHRESIAVLKAKAPEPAIEAPKAVAPPPAPTPKPARNEANSDEAFAAERRSLLAEAAGLMASFSAPVITIPPDADDEWFDAMERRLEASVAQAARAIPGGFVPIAAGVRGSTG